MSFLETMPSLADEIIFEEGLRMKPYKDSLGRWACGVGCDLEANGLLTDQGVPMMTSWSREQALSHLNIDLKEAVSLVRKYLPWSSTLDPVRERVLINMMYQMGWDNLRTARHEGLSSFTNTLAAIREGNYSKASDAMLASKWAKQTPARCLRMATRMRTGRYFTNP